MEIVLAVFGNLKVLAVAAAIALGLTSFIAAGFGFIQEEPVGVWLFKRALVGCVVAAIVACIPSVQDLWEVRIGLLKYELASPENVKAGAEAIQRIAGKLECKYLGGKGCEAAPKDAP